MKILSLVVPCYNSEKYMNKCIDSLLIGGDDIEIIIIDDGSTDKTGEVADNYASAYPDICRVIHEENLGHGGAVNTGIANAKGMYFKVVDSDDWLDETSYRIVLSRLRQFYRERRRVDLFIANYVYEHENDGTSHTINYRNVLPEEKVFTWREVRRFRLDQNLLMHSLIYRTKILRRSGMQLPEHTFYVDNLFAYIPLPYVKTLYYLNVDLYRYYTGRDDQSVNEKVMISRIDQQIRVNKLMIDAYRLPADVHNKNLSRYMLSYLAMICMVTSSMLLISGTPENQEKRRELWKYFREQSPATYRRVRWGIRGIGSNCYGRISCRVLTVVYRVVQKIYKFN